MDSYICGKQSFLSFPVGLNIPHIYLIYHKWWPPYFIIATSNLPRSHRLTGIATHHQFHCNNRSSQNRDQTLRQNQYSLNNNTAFISVGCLDLIYIKYHIHLRITKVLGCLLPAISDVPLHTGKYDYGIWPKPASVQTRFTGSAFTSSWVVCCRLELVYVIMAHLWEIHGNASPDICFTKWPQFYVLITPHGFSSGQIGIQQENCHLKM